MNKDTVIFGMMTKTQNYCKLMKEESLMCLVSNVGRAILTASINAIFLFINISIVGYDGSKLSYLWYFDVLNSISFS